MSSELDDFFGPRETTQGGELIVRRTNWPRAPERLRSILDAFEDVMGYHPQGQLQQSWVAGARDYADNVGESALFVRAAAEYLQSKGLTVKSPRSLIAVAMQWKLSGGEHQRNRYADFDTSED